MMHLVVMLTHNDRTVPNAREVFAACKSSQVGFWGIKEEPLPLEEMKQLFSAMKAAGKTTVLEVVAYTEVESLAGAEKAVACGCDVLMGTLFFDSVLALCQQHGMKYMPFVGTVTGRPSVLDGDEEEIIREARHIVEKGAYGVDLLGYRYRRAPQRLIKRLVAELDAPVCIAGSVNSYARLDEIKAAAPWGFTIGSAFFDHTFGDDFGEQVDAVYDYMGGAER